jgi:hypothetical protein
MFEIEKGSPNDHDPLPILNLSTREWPNQTQDIYYNLLVLVESGLVCAFVCSALSRSMICTTGLTHCFLPSTDSTAPEVEFVSGVPLPLTITNHLVSVVGGSIDHGNFKDSVTY